ncbi:hypothetical protein RHMOL_Rhmol11G0261700 [Rhododendron molle]|uniref:Uncharacterized protein n=1 Tax=Rhododendron molle TaxID=49168 RepID=A0ACC0LWW6_RHOML|nr:hypothetical protein RHMOL_Rhmol11G0261700 [Rhododendron molle]
MRGFVFARISRSTATDFTFVGASRSSSSEAVAHLFPGRGAEASLPYSLGWARRSSEGLNWRVPTEAAGNGKMRIFSPVRGRRSSKRCSWRCSHKGTGAPSDLEFS